MLAITVPLAESYDEELMEFVITSKFDLELEHSLASLSKWESKFEKPFLGETPKTNEETFEYIKLMAVTPNVPMEVFQHFTDDIVARINEYINGKHTATWVSDVDKKTHSREIITAEVIYHMMIALSIPHEYEHWHLNKLLMLIKVVNAKNSPPKKRSRAEMMEQSARINAERKAKYGTTG